MAEDIIVNLPTYEQVEDLKMTSGPIMGSDGRRYLANFDNGYNTVNFIEDLTNSEKFKASFDAIVATPSGEEWSADNVTVNFLPLKDNLALSFGVKTVGGENKIWYCITNMDTFEVIAGRWLKDEPGTVTYQNNAQMVDYCYDSKYVYIRVLMGVGSNMGLLLLDVNTFQFVKYLQLKNNGNTGNVGQLSVTNDGCIAVLTTQCFLYVYRLAYDGSGVPVSANEFMTNLQFGGTQNQQGLSLYTDGEFFYSSIIPSGTQIRNVKTKFNKPSSIFTEIAAFNLSGVPNPVPPQCFQCIKTLSDGRKLLVRFHGTSAPNVGYLTSIYLDTWVYKNSGQVSGTIATNAPTLGFETFALSNGNEIMKLGNANYSKLYILKIEDNGTLTFENMWAQSPSENSTDVRGNVQGFVTKNEVFITKSPTKRLLPSIPVYNIINYTREVSK